jgi:hypothetical protein
MDAVIDHPCANHEHHELKTLTDHDTADRVVLFETDGIAIERRRGGMAIICTSCAFGSEAARNQCLCPCHIEPPEVKQ